MMLKYVLIVFVFWYQIQRYIHAQSDTTRNITSFLQSSTKNDSTTTTTEELSKAPVVTMNGHTNYHVGQQVFYVYGEQQLKRLLWYNQGMGRFQGDYLTTPGIGTHKLNPRKLSWNKARRACIEEGGHLAVINSFSEEKILLRLMQDNNIQIAWLGLHDLFEEGDWVTVTGEALGNTGYTRWTTKYANEPDNYGGAQHCATLIPEGGMDDIGCALLFSFFCELPA